MSFLNGDSMGAIQMHYFTVYWVATEFVNFAVDFTQKMHFLAMEFNKKWP